MEDCLVKNNRKKKSKSTGKKTSAKKKRTTETNLIFSAQLLPLEATGP
jgi:bacillopeptidase F (M6 metalloprotease family)